MSYTQVSAEEVKKRLDPRLSPPSGLLGGLGGMSSGQSNNERHLVRIQSRLESINSELADVISRIGHVADRLLPRSEDGACSGARCTPTGILGEIEGAIDDQSDLLVRLRSIAFHLETIA